MRRIADRFVETATRHPDRTFVVAAYSPSFEELTYGESLRRAKAFAGHLRALGVAAGDRVVLNLPNSLEYVCAYFGIWLAGATIIPLDSRARPSHVARIVRDCTATCVVVQSPSSELEPTIRQVPLRDFDWSGQSGAADPVVPHNEIALIIYTSGTTGTPRGVCLSHENLEHTRASITSWARVSESDRELLTLPLTHLFGLAHLHVYCALGATMLIEVGFRDVPRMLQIIDQAAVTSFPTTPGSLKIVLDRFADSFASKARRLRYMIINTAPLPVATTEKLMALLPDTAIFMYYGLTEASRSTYIEYRAHPGKLETVGRATPGAEVSIGGPPPSLVGEPGEILVKGPHVMTRYWGVDPSDAFEQGWFRTGDLGMKDEQGFVTWLGRVRDQINVNGLKLVPAEVEEVLRLDERVVDCAAVGVPDASAGEIVVAFVVAQSGTADQALESQLRRLCSVHLDDYKVPRRVLFVDSLPKTESGKVQRYVLKDSFPRHSQRGLS